MAISRRDIQQAATASGTSVTTPAFSPVTETGDTIVVWVSAWTASGPTIQTPTDSKSNTYTQIGTTQNLTGGVRLACFRASNVTGGSSHTVTANVTPAATITVIAWALKLAAVAAYNGDTTGTVATTNRPASGLSTPAPAPDSYFISGVATDGPDDNIGQLQGWIIPTNGAQIDNTALQDLYTEHLWTQETSHAKQDGTYISTVTPQWAARVASFAPLFISFPGIEPRFADFPKFLLRPSR